MWRGCRAFKGPLLATAFLAVACVALGDTPGTPGFGLWRGKAGSAPVLPTGAELIWTFDTVDMSGATVNDLSGNGHAGTAQATASVPGHFNQALSYGGTNSWVLANSGSNNLDLMGPRTLSAWVNTTSVNRQIVAKYDGGGAETGYALAIDGSGNFIAFVGGSNNTSSVRKTYNTNVVVSDGYWHHVAATFDTTTSSNNIVVYVDGVAKATGSQGLLTNPVGASFAVGYPALYLDMAGSIDEVRVYDRVLSASDMQALAYNEAREELPDGAVSTGWIDMTSNVILYHLNDAGGTTTAVDSSGQNHGGTCGQGLFSGDSCPTFGSVGQLNSGSSFAGGVSNNNIDFGGNWIEAVNDLSISFWMKGPTSGIGTIIDESVNFDLSETTFHIDATAGGNLRFKVGDEAGAVNTLTAATPSNSAWHHVVAVSSSAASKNYLYIDGVLAASGNRTVGQLGVNNGGSGATLCIGGESDFGATPCHSNLYSGGLDELAVWTRSLTPAEVKLIYVMQSTSGVQTAKQIQPDWTPQWGSLVGAWHIDDSAGAGTVVDSSGNGADLTNNGATLGAAGKISTAGTFDGTGSYLTDPNGDFDPQSFTLAAWFKTTTSDGGTLVGMTDSPDTTLGSYDRHIWMRTDGTLSFGVFDTSLEYMTSPLSYNDGLWHHVVGAFTPGSFVLYVDGVAVASRTDVFSAQNYTGYWHVGYGRGCVWGGCGVIFFAGTLDEVGIWHKALSAGEISAIYRRQK